MLLPNMALVLNIWLHANAPMALAVLGGSFRVPESDRSIVVYEESIKSSHESGMRLFTHSA